MKIHRFIGDFDLAQNTLEIGGEEGRQMAKILRLEPGEKIELSDGKGKSALAEIIEIVGAAVKIRVESREEAKLEREVSLYCAILKKENFELVVQKATECGVSKIIPILTARTIKTGLNMERLRKIAKEAAEQSGRNSVPEISEPRDFKNALEATTGENILFHMSGTKFEKSGTKNMNIWIGPEGGWSEEELTLSKEKSFSVASLGPLTLRGETAAMIGSYLAVNL